MAKETGRINNMLTAFKERPTLRKSKEIDVNGL